MTVVLDPDLLNQGTEIIFDTTVTPRTIELVDAGNLTGAKVALQCIFSFAYEEWKTDATLVKHPFPLEPIDGPSGTQFNLSEEWEWKTTTSTTINKIADGGWAWKTAAGVSIEEWMNITSLGAFLAPTDLAYFTQGNPDAPVDTNNSDVVNQAVKIYGDATHGNFDYRNDFIIFLREQGKSFEQYDLITAQNITALDYKRYQVPLSNSSDPLVTHSDAEIALAPYTNINYTYHSVPVQRNMDGSNYDFKHIWEGDSKSLEQIWEKHQYLKRETGDIDSDAVGTLRGDTSNLSMYWDSGILYVDGFIDNVAPADVNRVAFKDDLGTYRTYKYTSAGEFKPNQTLIDDPASYIRFFFANDDAGDNTGRDYGTDNAMLINDNSGTPLSFDISGRSAIAYDYDYDNNVQRGAASAGTDVPYVAVASGISGSLAVVATGTITRTKTNDVILVASKQLTYSNPA